MHADQIFFGIELETTLPADDTTPIGPYHHGYQVPWLLAGWKAKRDGSIRALVPGRKGCEFVSPKLRGPAGLREVEEAIDAINARGAGVNPSCGLQLTIQWDGDASALARLISLVGNHEKAIFAGTGTRRREREISGSKASSDDNPTDLALSDHSGPYVGSAVRVRNSRWNLFCFAVGELT
jgi:hypothetical protein